MATSVKPKEQGETCRICLEQYKSPCSLPCHHTFCEKCLQRWAKNSDKPGMMTCPNCKKETEIPEFQSTDIKEETKDEKADCGLCDTSGKPSSYCRDCEEFMCEKCHSSHKKIKACKDHQVVTVEEFHSGQVTKSSKEMYCDKHDGEQIKFYCETCDKLVCRDCILMKNCCRDHDYCTLKEASQRKVHNLGDLLRECQESMKKCQSAIEDVEKEETELITKKEGFQDILKKLNSAYELGKKLTESRSDFEILSNYSFIIETLQEAGNIKTIPAGATTSTKIESSEHIYIKNLKQWKEVKEFSTQGGQPIGITTTPGDDIAILCSDKVKVFSQSGDIKSSFSCVPNAAGITCTQDGKYVITASKAKRCYIYDAQGKEVSSFPFGKNQIFLPGPIALDNQGNIIIGWVRPDTSSNGQSEVSVYSSTGAQMNLFKTGESCRGLAVTNNRIIAVTCSPRDLNYGYGYGYLQLKHPIGSQCSNAQNPPKTKYPNKWLPHALCYSKTDDLLFVTTSGDTKGVYMYTGDGGYLKCVTTKIGVSHGIALSQDDQTLFVSNWDVNTVQIFQRP